MTSHLSHVTLGSKDNSLQSIISFGNLRANRGIIEPPAIWQTEEEEKRISDTFASQVTCPPFTAYLSRAMFFYVMLSMWANHILLEIHAAGWKHKSNKEQFGRHFQNNLFICKKFVWLIKIIALQLKKTTNKCKFCCLQS